MAPAGRRSFPNAGLNFPVPARAKRLELETPPSLGGLVRRVLGYSRGRHFA